MQGLVEPFLDDLQQVKTLDQLTRHIVDLRNTLNVEHVIYHSVNSTGEQYAALTYSDEWVGRYLDRDYARIDPVVQGCYRRFVPVDWKAPNWVKVLARSRSAISSNDVNWPPFAQGERILRSQLLRFRFNRRRSGHLRLGIGRADVRGDRLAD